MLGSVNRSTMLPCQSKFSRGFGHVERHHVLDVRGELPGDEARVGVDVSVVCQRGRGDW